VLGVVQVVPAARAARGRRGVHLDIALRSGKGGSDGGTDTAEACWGQSAMVQRAGSYVA